MAYLLLKICSYDITKTEKKQRSDLHGKTHKIMSMGRKNKYWQKMEKIVKMC